MFGLDRILIGAGCCVVINQGAQASLDPSQKVKELEEYTRALETEEANLATLKKLIVLCHQNPSQNSSSPPTSPLSSKIGNVPLTPASPSPRSFTEHTTVLGDIWDGGKRSGALFNSLCTFLKPDKVYLIPNCNVFYA